MDPLAFWTTITILSAACGGGFLFLAYGVDKLKTEITNRPSFKEVAHDYARKEVMELQFKAIEKDVKLILEKILELKNNHAGNHIQKDK